MMDNYEEPYVPTPPFKPLRANYMLLLGLSVADGFVAGLIVPDPTFMLIIAALSLVALWFLGPRIDALRAKLGR